ncbi:hypothetical protein GN244_ATG04083 [Phytophthora infestans]|uniref:Uncharacterized protein n=1 Tax=Phytophthora infestans TaxID=4787 RepID=A0A833TI58_PHYIN|nr:hypothetical protein GN244_ATG04083 [Phytophthora infestans]
MSALDNAYTDNSSRFDAILDEIMNGVPLDEIDRRNHDGWWWEGATRGARGVVRRMWGVDDRLQCIRFRQEMDTRQTRLQRHWVDAVEKAVNKLHDIKRLDQLTTDRVAQMQLRTDKATNEAFERLRVYLVDSSGRQLEAKISALRVNADCSCSKY